MISHTIDCTCLVGDELTRVFIVITSPLIVCNEIAFNLLTLIIKVEVLTIDDLIKDKSLSIVTEVVPIALPIEELIGPFLVFLGVYRDRRHDPVAWIR